MAGDFDLHQLLAGPIIAMNDAQGAAAAHFYTLFDQFAFEPAEPAATAAEPAARRLRMISFIAERATITGIERRQISMPLLQMIPIGGIGIDAATIEFTLAVNAEPSGQPNNLSRALAGTAPTEASAAPPLALKARLAPTGTNGDAGNLKVEIMLRQLDLPAGLLDMIAETQGGVSQRIAEDLAPTPAPPPTPAPTELPLFDAAVRESSASAIQPGREYALTLEITPNAKLADDKGIEIALASVPRRALEIVQPEGPLRVGSKPVRANVLLYVTDAVADYSLRTNVILSLTGIAAGAGGQKVRHSVSVVLPRIASETKP